MPSEDDHIRSQVALSENEGLTTPQKERLEAILAHEIEVSERDHRLIISPELREKEKRLVIEYFKMKGGFAIVKTMTFEDLITDFGSFLRKNLEQELEQYWDTWTSKIDGPRRIAYSAHLHTLIGSMINIIYNEFA